MFRAVLAFFCAFLFVSLTASAAQANRCNDSRSYKRASCVDLVAVEKAATRGASRSRSNQTRLDNLKANRDALKDELARVRALVRSNSAWRPHLEALESDIEGIDEQVSILQAQVAELDTRVTELEKKCAKLGLTDEACLAYVKSQTENLRIAMQGSVLTQHSAGGAVTTHTTTPGAGGSDTAYTLTPAKPPVEMTTPGTEPKSVIRRPVCVSTRTTVGATLLHGAITTEAICPGDSTGGTAFVSALDTVPEDDGDLNWLEGGLTWAAGGLLAGGAIGAGVGLDHEAPRTRRDAVGTVLEKTEGDWQSHMLIGAGAGAAAMFVVGALVHGLSDDI